MGAGSGEGSGEGVGSTVGSGSGEMTGSCVGSCVGSGVGMGVGSVETEGVGLAAGEGDGAGETVQPASRARQRRAEHTVLNVCLNGITTFCFIPVKYSTEKGELKGFALVFCRDFLYNLMVNKQLCTERTVSDMKLGIGRFRADFIRLCISMIADGTP